MMYRFLAVEYRGIHRRRKKSPDPFVIPSESRDLYFF